MPSWISRRISGHSFRSLEYLRFLHLCWKAYNGDVGAALEVIRVLREKFGL